MSETYLNPAQAARKRPINIWIWADTPAIRRATPRWADRQRIVNIYAESGRRSRRGKLKYHVDHVIPLIHPKVCGLHVHNNLQILTARKNCQKNNRWADV